MDKPDSITSIAVKEGFINYVWFEEAYQVRKEDDFNKIDLSIRGSLPEGYFKQVILTFNPWSDKSWLDWYADGTRDHVGIVERCDGRNVYTIEGNRSDAVRRGSYSVGSGTIGAAGPAGRADGVFHTNAVRHSAGFFFGAGLPR